MRETRYLSLAAVVAILTSSPLGAAYTAGTEPAVSAPPGSYNLVYWHTLTCPSGKSCDSASPKVLVLKLLSENNPASDWYGIATYMMETQSKYEYDYAHLWTAPFVYDGNRPDEVSWQPGKQAAGGQLTWTVSTSGVGFTWTEPSGFNWDILEQKDQDSTPWVGRLHQESGVYANKEDRKRDWSAISFGSWWRVDQGKSVGANVGAKILWDGPSLFDCWYPCHEQGTSCDPCTWISFEDHASTECALRNTLAPVTRANGTNVCGSTGELVPPSLADPAPDVPSEDDLTHPRLPTIQARAQKEISARGALVGCGGSMADVSAEAFQLDGVTYVAAGTPSLGVLQASDATSAEVPPTFAGRVACAPDFSFSGNPGSSPISLAVKEFDCSANGTGRLDVVGTENGVTMRFVGAGRCEIR